MINEVKQKTKAAAAAESGPQGAVVEGLLFEGEQIR